MAVFRVERNKGYTVMSNYHLKDKRLTLKSKGLLSMMLSLPDEWNYSTRGLAAICKEGVDAIGAALKELENTGYIVRNQFRGERGRIVDTEYVIYEKPQDKPGPDTPKTPGISGRSPHTAFPYMVNPDMANPDMDKPDTDNPDTENPAQYITKQAIPEKGNKDISSTNPSIHLSIPEFPAHEPTPRSRGKPDGMDGIDRMDRAKTYRELIMENIGYDCLIQQYGCGRMDEVVELMLETILSKRPYIRVAGDEYPAEVVKSRMLKVTSQHIEYVFGSLDQNTTKIHNIKAYLLTMLYNAPATMDSFYRAEVNHDLYGL